MEWAKNQGIPFDVDCFRIALEQGSLKQMQWLFNHGQFVDLPISPEKNQH